MLLIGGAIAAVLGLILLIIGAVQNSSFESQLLMAFGQPGTGTGLVVFGIILLLAGIGVVVFDFLKKKKKK